MTVRIAVCDDEEYILRQIKEMIEEYRLEKKMNITVSAFTSGEELLMEIEDHGIYDIIYLDIELTRLDGIGIARKLRCEYPEALFIFVSSYSVYYREAFDVQPFQFIDKPIDRSIFYDVLERAIYFTKKYPHTISFYYNRIYYKIRANTILYFESDKRIIRVICEEKSYEFYGKLSEIEKQVNGQDNLFLRINKSFLINMNYIKELSTTYIIMSDGMRIAVSVEKRKDVRNFYLKWMSCR